MPANGDAPKTAIDAPRTWTLNPRQEKAYNRDAPARRHMQLSTHSTMTKGNPAHLYMSRASARLLFAFIRVLDSP